MTPLLMSTSALQVSPDAPLSALLSGNPSPEELGRRLETDKAINELHW
jgi:hypothetical protein